MLPLKQRAVFCRALALQLAAGADPVVTAGTAASALPSRWRPAGELLASALARGESFHAALGAAALLPASDLSLVDIGERSGALDEVLRELADFHEESAALRPQIISGLALPAFNLVAACFIVPLPGLVLKGDTVGYLVAALGPIALLLAVVFGLGRMLPRASGRTLDRWVRPLPLVGAALQEIDAWRFFRTLALLSRTSHGIIDSVRLAAQACRSEHLRELLTFAANDAEARGAPVGPLLERRGAFPPDVAAEWRTGERTGQLEAAFRRIGTRYGETSRQRLKTLAEWTPRLVYLVVMAVMAWQVLRLAGSYFDSLTRVVGG